MGPFPTGVENYTAKTLHTIFSKLSVAVVGPKGQKTITDYIALNDGFLSCVVYCRTLRRAARALQMISDRQNLRDHIPLIVSLRCLLCDYVPMHQPPKLCFDKVAACLKAGIGRDELLAYLQRSFESNKNCLDFAIKLDYCDKHWELIVNTIRPVVQNCLILFVFPIQFAEFVRNLRRKENKI